MTADASAAAALAGAAATSGTASVVAAPWGGADLHAHTVASDGEATPTELVSLAVAAGLAAVGITDHDTVAGVEEAMESASGNVEVVPGIEFSCDSTVGTCHLLGLFIDPRSPYLTEPLTFLRKRRRERAAGILRRLEAAGITLTLPERPDPYAVGRPHIARALVDGGFVGSHQEAFERFLAVGKPAFMPSPRLTPADAIQMIMRSGGVAVVAHPHTLGNASMVSVYQAQGLVGVEARYGGYDARHVTYWTKLAGKMGLAITAGSDFHGKVRPDRPLGLVRMTEEEFAELKRRRKR